MSQRVQNLLSHIQLKQQQLVQVPLESKHSKKWNVDKRLLLILILVSILVLLYLEWNYTMHDYYSHSMVLNNDMNNQDMHMSSNLKTNFILNLSSIDATTFPIFATPAEKQELFSQTKNKDYYLEWGSGGSTEIVPYLINKQAYSIEHAQPWCDKMVKGSAAVQLSIAFNRLTYNCVDTKAKLVQWGKPSADSNVTLMGDIYVNFIDKIGINKFDVIFIDGRFRVACALKVILGEYYHNNSIIMMHDYQPNRINRNYTAVEKYYNKMKCTQSLCIFQVKPLHMISFETLHYEFVKYIGDYA